MLTSATLLVSLVLAQPLPESTSVRAVKMFEVPHYSEGVVFDHEGRGYISAGPTIFQFELDGTHRTWAETGAPNGHKILADGTHLVCDAGQHAVLHLSEDGKPLTPAAAQCDGQPLNGPNDLTLDTPHGGFYFSDPDASPVENPTGSIKYCDADGRVSRLDDGLAFPNGIVLSADGKRLLLAESKKNRVLEYAVSAAGKLGPRRVFAELPAKDESRGQIDNQPDGMCLDAAGNLYVAHYGMREVQVLDPTGKLIARYEGGNLTTSNVAFGGPHGNQLYVTGGLAAEAGGGGLFRLDLKVEGLLILPAKK